jgi:hypothetical protein
MRHPQEKIQAAKISFAVWIGFYPMIDPSRPN